MPNTDIQYSYLKSLQAKEYEFDSIASLLGSALECDTEAQNLLAQKKTALCTFSENFRYHVMIDSISTELLYQGKGPSQNQQTVIILHTVARYASVEHHDAYTIIPLAIRCLPNDVEYKNISINDEGFIEIISNCGTFSTNYNEVLNTLPSCSVLFNEDSLQKDLFHLRNAQSNPQSHQSPTSAIQHYNTIKSIHLNESATILQKNITINQLSVSLFINSDAPGKRVTLILNGGAKTLETFTILGRGIIEHKKAILTMDDLLILANQIITHQTYFTAQDYLIRYLLPIKNGEWRQYDYEINDFESPLTYSEFAKCIKLHSIALNNLGHITMYFDDIDPDSYDLFNMRQMWITTDRSGDFIDAGLFPL